MSNTVKVFLLLLLFGVSITAVASTYSDLNDRWEKSIKNGNYSEAMNIVKDMIRLSKGLRDKNEFALATFSRGETKFYLKEYKRAEADYEMAVNLYDSQNGKNGVSSGTVYCSIARNYYMQNEKVEAYKNFKIALTIYGEKLGNAHDFNMTPLSWLAKIAHELNKNEEAEMYFKRCLNVIKINHGEVSIEMATEYGDMSKYYVDIKNFKNASDAAEKSYMIFRELKGKLNLQTTYMLSMLSEFRCLNGDYSRSVVGFKAANEIADKNVRAFGERTASNYYYYVFSLVHMGLLDEAKTVQKRYGLFMDAQVLTNDPKFIETKDSIKKVINENENLNVGLIRSAFTVLYLKCLGVIYEY